MVDSVLHNRMQEVLLANDQLRIEMRRRNVFAGFQEAEITFQPTYKYQVDKRRRKSDPALQQQPAGSRKSNANNLGRSKTINSATPTSRKGTASTVSPPSTANSASSDDDDDDDADDDDYDDSEDNSNDKQATEAITTITDKRRSDTSMVAQSSGDGKTNNSNALRRPQRITKPSSSQIQKSNGTTTAAKRHQQYDNSPKQRIPSWTDRILWRDNNRHRLPNLAGGIRAEKYDCCMRMRQSDHKPVYGVFTVQVNWDKMVEERNQRQRPTKKSTDSCKIL
jgi:hypothetical protein